MEYVEPLSLESVLPKIWGDIKEMWPELVGIDGLYVTGGQVWRRYYGVGESKDTDFVAVTPEALKEASDILTDEHHEWNEDIYGGEPYMTPLGGKTYFTERGKVDLWEDTDVRTTLRRYSDERSHARMAIHMKNGIFIKLPNAVERKPGEKYIVTNPDGSVTWPRMSRNLTQAQLDKLWDRTKTKHTLLVADYSSLEIGIQGDLCKRLFDDDQLIEAYKAQLHPTNPVDLHSNNARNVFGTWLKWTVPLKMTVKDKKTGEKKEIKPEYAGQRADKIPVAEFKEHPFGKKLRDLIKAIWYGLAYGKRGYGFQTLRGVDGKEIGLAMADRMVEALLDAVPGMRKWDEWVKKFVRKYHGIYSLGGRWCDLERECSTGDDWDFARAVRRALNFPMQATGAEIIGDAMVRLHRCNEFKRTGFRVCLQVHDELVARGPLDNVVLAQQLLVKHMREATANGTQLLVQVEVSSSYAQNYGECK